MAGGEPIISKIGKMVVADDQFTLKPEIGMQSLKQFPEEEKLTYPQVADAVNILETWRNGPGREEV
jgi:hypothetical protein